MKKLSLLMMMLVLVLQMQAETMTKLMESPSGNKGVFQYDFNINEDGCTATVTQVALIDSPLDYPSYDKLRDHCFLAIPEIMEVDGNEYIVTAVGDSVSSLINRSFYCNLEYLPQTVRYINRLALGHSIGTAGCYFNGAEIDYLHPQSGIAQLYIYATGDHISTYLAANDDMLFDMVLGKDFKADESLSSLDKTDRQLQDKIRYAKYNTALSYLPLSNCINLHVSDDCQYYEEKDGSLYHRSCNDTILSVIATSTNDDTAMVVIPKEIKAITLPHAGHLFKQGLVKISFEEGSQLEQMCENALTRTHINALPASLREYKADRFNKALIDHQPQHADIIHKHAFNQVTFPNDSVLVVPSDASVVEENAYENSFFKLAKDGVIVFWSKNPDCTFTRQNIRKKEIHLEGTNILAEGSFADTTLQAVFLNRQKPPKVLYNDGKMSSGGIFDVDKYLSLCYTTDPDHIPWLYIPKGSFRYYQEWWLPEKLREYDFNNDLGDLNGDNTIDVADVDRLIDMVLGKQPQDLGAADLNGDGQLDVTDVDRLIDKVLGKQ